MFGSMLRSWFIVCCFSLVTLIASADCFQTVELTPVQPLVKFENSVRYEITYWQTLDGKKFQVFPNRADKEKDYDLILAAVVRYYIEVEYQAKGHYLDEAEVQPTTAQEILHQVSIDFLSAAWGKGNQQELGFFLRQNSNSLKLNKLVAYLDYIGEKGEGVSGIDIDPILFQFGATPERADEVSIICVKTSND